MFSFLSNLLVLGFTNGFVSSSPALDTHVAKEIVASLPSSIAVYEGELFTMWDVNVQPGSPSDSIVFTAKTLELFSFEQSHVTSITQTGGCRAYRASVTKSKIIDPTKLLVWNGTDFRGLSEIVSPEIQDRVQFNPLSPRRIGGRAKESMLNCAKDIEQMQDFPIQHAEITHSHRPQEIELRTIEDYIVELDFEEVWIPKSFSITPAEGYNIDDFTFRHEVVWDGWCRSGEDPEVKRSYVFLNKENGVFSVDQARHQELTNSPEGEEGCFFEVSEYRYDILYQGTKVKSILGLPRNGC